MKRNLFSSCFHLHIPHIISNLHQKTSPKPTYIQPNLNKLFRPYENPHQSRSWPQHNRQMQSRRTFREYQYTREIAAAVVARLQALGHDAEVLVPEFEDILLSERVRRVNAWCRRLGKDNVVLVSVHVDAAGSDGQRHTATGWSCYTSPGRTAGDRLADCLYRAAQKHLQGHKIRTDYSDGDADKEACFALLTRTRFAAALTENGFQDSKESLAFLESPAGKKAVIGLHVEGIIDFYRE